MKGRFDSALRKRLINQPKAPCLILDGGMGTSMSNMGFSEYDTWSAPRRLNEAHIRDKVKEVHMNFLESGVDILTTSTYDFDYELDDTGPYQMKSQWVFENLNLVKETVDEFMAKKSKSVDVLRPLLAMSVGSVATRITGRAETANREHEVDHDGDCTRVEGYGYKASEIIHYFNVRLADDILRHAAMYDVAVIAFETVGDLLEVQVICDVLKTKADLLTKTAMSTWVTLTCLDEETVDTGGSVTACIELLARCPQVTGVGVNCTEPHLVTPIIGKIKQVLKECDAEDKLIVVYPNSGEIYLSRDLKDGETNYWKAHSSYKDWNFADAAMDWIDNGAHIVGGCCRITAQDIAELAQKVGKI